MNHGKLLKTRCPRPLRIHVRTILNYSAKKRRSVKRGFMSAPRLPLDVEE